MLYYKGRTVSFQEVPDEVSLVILISNCPHRCPGCHSPDLWKAEGRDLEEDLDSLIDEYENAITCVCFMGDGQDEKALLRCADRVHERGLKTAVYSGYDNAHRMYFPHFDYCKTGRYIELLGGLDKKTTNQRMFKITKQHHDEYLMEDITDVFWQSKY